MAAIQVRMRSDAADPCTRCTLKDLGIGKAIAVKNLRIFAPLVNGEQFELADCLTGRDLVKGVFQNHWAAPPQALVIEASDKEGRVIRIVIPYDDSETARITVAEES
jgi:hypothetical protein